MKKTEIIIPYVGDNQRKRITVQQLLSGYAGLDRDYYNEKVLEFRKGNEISIFVNEENIDRLLYFFNMEDIQYRRKE